MLRLLGLVISIGLADCVNPSTIAPGLYLATGPRPRRAVIEFTLGVGIVTFLGGALIAAGPGEAVLALVPHPGPVVRYALETAAGAAMLLGAVYLWRRRARLRAKELPQPSGQRRSSALLGASIAAVELPTAVPYLAVLVAIVGSGRSLADQLILILIYNVCFVLPLILIVVTLTVAPGRARQVLDRAQAWLQHHWPALLAGLALLAGGFVIAIGITGLLGTGHGTVGKLSRRVRKAITR
jgi:cytochrome c biogenesis protein CcdA